MAIGHLDGRMRKTRLVYYGGGLGSAPQQRVRDSRAGGRTPIPGVLNGVSPKDSEVFNNHILRQVGRMQ